MRFGLAFILLVTAPLWAQTNQLAGVQQDLAELRTEVEKLKLDNADLRDALAKQKASQGQTMNNADAQARLRTEILNELDRRLKQQTAEVNAALTEQTRQVNAALGKNPPPATRPTQPNNTAPGANPPVANNPTEGMPAGMPETGVKYHVKSGDSVARIARQLGSKVEWILAANKLSSPAALKADVDIFVPQPETPAR
jgi:LysM repeat protein